MPICPNKKSPAWTALIDDLKNKNPKSTESNIEALAYIAFFKKGDIPTIQEATDILFKGKTKTVKAEIRDVLSSFKLGRSTGIKNVKEGLKEFVGKVSDYTKTLSSAGKISVSQGKSIANKAAKIGTSEASFNKFVKYVDNVVENANYAEEVADIRKMQKSALKGKDPLSTEIKEFIGISPEDIPLQSLTKYKQALDLLTGKVKDPSLMREMSAEIQDIKQQLLDEYEAKSVATVEQAEAMLNDINAIQLDSVESYRNKIGEINKLRRKVDQLLDNGDITDVEYDNIIDGIGKTQDDFERINKAEIDNIKRGYVDEIKAKKIETDIELSTEEQALIDRVNEIRDEDLMQMSPEELYVLNEAIDVANNGYIDIAKLNESVDAAASVSAKNVSEQLNSAKNNNKNTEDLVRRLKSKDDVFWEYALGLPINKIGEIYKEIITPYRRGMANYVNSVNEIRRAKLLVEKVNKLDKKEHHKVGFIAHYLQEYMNQFNPKFKNVKDAGKRDEFASKLFNKEYTDKVGDKDTLKIMQDVYESLPKGADGKVNPEDIYNDYINNGEKYLTENQHDYLRNVWDIWDKSVTPKQDYATRLRGRPLNKLSFYMPREYYSTSKMQTAQAPVSVSRNGRNIRIESPFSKERVITDIEKADIPKTDFSYLMHKALENSIRDYEVTRMLHGLNRRLNAAYKNTNPNKRKYLDAVVDRMKAGVEEQIGAKASDPSADMYDKILAATAVKALFDINRAFLVELPSGFASYPIRGGTGAAGYAQAFKGSKIVSEIKSFTESPLRIRENINAKFDIDSQKVVLPPRLNRISQWMTGFTEAHLNNMIWMPKFKDAFFDATGKKFSEKEFSSNPEYKKTFSKEIKDAGSIADQATQEIVGPTTTASARMTVDNIFTNLVTKGKPLPIRSNWGKVLSFMGNYGYRDYVSFFKGFKESADAVRNGDGISSLTKLTKPLGVLVGLSAYGYLSDLKYMVDKYLISSVSGDEEEFEYAKERIQDKYDTKSVWEELGQNFVQIGSGKYGADARLVISALGTLGYHATDDKDTKKMISDFVRETTYSKIPDLSKVGQGQYGKIQASKEILLLLSKNIAVIGTVVERLVDAAGGVDAAAGLIERYNRGEDIGDMNDWGAAMELILGSTQLVLLGLGTSLPESKKLKELVDSMQDEVKKSKGGGMKGGMKMGGMGGGSMRMGR